MTQVNIIFQIVGVNVDCVNLNGQTALYLSVLDSRKELVEILLKHAADPNL